MERTVLGSGIGDDDGRQQEGAEHNAGDEEGATLRTDRDSGARLSTAARFAT